MLDMQRLLIFYLVPVVVVAIVSRSRPEVVSGRHLRNALPIHARVRRASESGTGSNDGLTEPLSRSSASEAFLLANRTSYVECGSYKKGETVSVVEWLLKDDSLVRYTTFETDTNVPSSDRYHLGDSYRLVIQNARPTDDGNYKCSVQYKNHEPQSHSVKVTVLDFAADDPVISHQRNLGLGTSDEILDCPVSQGSGTASGASSVFWAVGQSPDPPRNLIGGRFADGESVVLTEEQDRYDILINGSLHVLRTVKVTTLRFWCLVSSSDGARRSSGYVDVNISGDNDGNVWQKCIWPIVSIIIIIIISAVIVCCKLQVTCAKPRKSDVEDLEGQQSDARTAGSMCQHDSNTATHGISRVNAPLLGELGHCSNDDREAVEDQEGLLMSVLSQSSDDTSSTTSDNSDRTDEPEQTDDKEDGKRSSDGTPSSPPSSQQIELDKQQPSNKEPEQLDKSTLVPVQQDVVKDVPPCQTQPRRDPQINGKDDEEDKPPVQCTSVATPRGPHSDPAANKTDVFIAATEGDSGNVASTAGSMRQQDSNTATHVQQDVVKDVPPCQTQPRRDPQTNGKEQPVERKPKGGKLDVKARQADNRRKKVEEMRLGKLRQYEQGSKVKGDEKDKPPVQCTSAPTPRGPHSDTAANKTDVFTAATEGDSGNVASTAGSMRQQDSNTATHGPTKKKEKSASNRSPHQCTQPV